MQKKEKILNDLKNHKIARVKLFEIDRKLSEIVRNNELNNYQKNDYFYNKLNNLIYYKKIFKNNYDRKELADQFEINAWESYKNLELDRVVHITTVFVHLIKSRKQELNNSYISSNSKYKDNRVYEESIYRLIETVEIFFKLIDQKIEFFNENGVTFIKNLKSMFNKVN